MFEVEITINNAISKGTIEITNRSIVLRTASNSTEIKYEQINNVIMSSQNQITIQLKNSILIYVNSEQMDIIYNQINNKISNSDLSSTKLNQSSIKQHESLTMCNKDLVRSQLKKEIKKTNRLVIVSFLLPIVCLVLFIIIGFLKMKIQISNINDEVNSVTYGGKYE